MNKIVCSGALFYTLSTNRFLFLHRSNGKRKNLWGLVGGTNEGAETPWTALLREIEEEVGFVPEIKKTIPLETFISHDELFLYHTYICLIEDEFIPVLNDEHDGYAWVKLGKWPKPLHDGVKKTLTTKVNLRKLETVFQILNIVSKENNNV